MRQTGQTREVRLLRLSEGRCPVHGQPMTLLGVAANGLRVMHCPRTRCEVTGVQMPTGRPAVRLPKAHQHLLSVACSQSPDKTLSDPLPDERPYGGTG
jgi:hypothetical protein